MSANATQDPTKHSEVVSEVEAFMHGLEKRNPGEPEFHQAVREVTESLMPFILANPEYKKAQILERLTEPDRIVIFRVTWEDDEGQLRANRAWRVQFNNSIGPVQRRDAFSPDGDSERAQVFGVRTDFQEQLDRIADGRRQGRVQL